MEFALILLFLLSLAAWGCLIYTIFKQLQLSCFMLSCVKEVAEELTDEDWKRLTKKAKGAFSEIVARRASRHRDGTS